MSRTPSGPQLAAGFSLIELMVGLLIGLLISGAAIGIMITNTQTQRATSALNRVQENARTTFELMARDVREAGGSACSRNVPIANVLNNRDSAWWAGWGDAVSGYDDGTAFADLPFGSGAGQRINGTDAIELKSINASGYSVEEHTPASAQFKLNTATHDLKAGDILMVCDYKQAAIFQMTGPNATNATVVHNTGAGSPGNCSKGLGFKVPMDCSTNGSAYAYGPNSQVARLRAVRWYVGANGRGGRSLYQSALRNSGGSPALTTEEVAEGVTDLQIEYLLTGASSYVAASAIAAADWKKVTAVRLSLTLESAQGDNAGEEKVGTDGRGLKRQFSHVVALRNRSA